MKFMMDLHSYLYSSSVFDIRIDIDIESNVHIKIVKLVNKCVGIPLEEITFYLEFVLFLAQ